MTIHPVSSDKRAISQDALNDLQRRLDQVNWPHRAAGTAVPGFDTERLRPLVECWRHDFDWRAVEARLEGLGQLTPTIGERRLHTVHSRGGDRLPVLLIHGWPDSPLRFVHLVPLLTAAGHDVVAPTIPGFGLSEEPDGDISRELVAEVFHSLMIELGYHRYAVHGGDWGSAIGTSLASLHPEAVAALHLIDVPFDLAFAIDEASATAGEMDYLRSLEEFAGGQLYLTAVSSQPDVTALALTDSPVGLLAWVAHIYDQWSDAQICTEDLLAAASLMWLTGTVRSSMRLYSEPADSGNELAWANDDAPCEPAGVETPTAFALFPKDICMPPRALADRHFSVERFTVMPAGGHFAALEQPTLLADDLISFLQGRS